MPNDTYYYIAELLSSAKGKRNAFLKRFEFYRKIQPALLPTSIARLKTDRRNSPPPPAFHLSPYCHRKPNPPDSKVFASRVALGPLFVQTLPISTNGVTCKTPFLSAVRTIRYHNSAEPKIPPQGQHSILTVAPHCIRAAYTELFEWQKLTVAPTAPSIAPPSASWEPTTARTAIDPARPKIDCQGGWCSL